MPSLPRGTGWRASLPTASATVTTLPAATRSRLPQSSVYVPPPLGFMTLLGMGRLSFATEVGTALTFAGAGTLDIDTTVDAALDLAGDSFLSFGAGADAAFGGEGSLDLTAVPNVALPGTGFGAPAFTAAPRVALTGAGAGSVSMSAAPRVTAPLGGTGALSFTAATVFAPSGMNKSTAYTITTAYALVPSWTADITGYPGSVVTSDGLVVQGGKTGATIAASCSVTNTNFGLAATGTLRLLVNGVVAVTGTGVSIPMQGSGTIAVSGTVTIHHGDAVTLQALASTANFLQINTGTSSYVRIT